MISQLRNLYLIYYNVYEEKILLTIVIYFYVYLVTKYFIHKTCKGEGEED